MRKTIAVVGGGTAGWLTGLLVRRFYPQHKVVVIESTKIGILGAGEGTTPYFIYILDYLGIPVSDLVKYAKATFKLGIKFTNWNGDGLHYYHGFRPQGDLGWRSCDSQFLNFALLIKEAANNATLARASTVEKMCSTAKVPFMHMNDMRSKTSNPILHFNNVGAFAVHFDARKLAEYLKLYSQAQFIDTLDGEVNNVRTDENGNINRLYFESGAFLDCDFVFDCSGFQRLLIGKHHQSEWKSYSDYLPLKAAVPFFIEHDNKNIKPETEAIAMKYGWIWKIPVQGRYGCGYVFDSDHITADQALKEAEEYFGHPLTSPTNFKFSAGTYKDLLVKNCMAVGLSGGFVEPLEATSIWISCLNLVNLLSDGGLFNQDPDYQKEFNAKCFKRNEEVCEFLQFHYLTERNDSEFWQSFRNKIQILPGLKEKMDSWKTSLPSEFSNLGGSFVEESWLEVGFGTKGISKQAFINLAQDRSLDERLKDSYEAAIDNQDLSIFGCLSHDMLINYLKN